MIEKYQDSKGNIHKLTTDVEQIILEDMNSLTKTLVDKYKEIERLKDRIDKAIEYLENTPRIVKTLHYRDKESNYAFIENKVKKELLEILDKVEENK